MPQKTFKDSELAVPMRIARNNEEPIDREFWFETEFTSGWQSLNGLLTRHLIAEKIPYTHLLGQVWFLYQDTEWCRCEFECDGAKVKVFLLRYLQN